LILFADIAPEFDCPTIQGPKITDRKYVEFDCVVLTNTTDPANARFEAIFKFNSEPSALIPPANAQVANGEARATLREWDLHGNIGKWVGLLTKRT
jgi:hypothetical protein